MRNGVVLIGRRQVAPASPDDVWHDVWQETRLGIWWGLDDLGSNLPDLVVEHNLYDYDELVIRWD